MPAGQDEKQDGGHSTAKDSMFPVLGDNNERNDKHMTSVNEDEVAEWEAMPEIPEHWRPLPLFQVRHIPISEDVHEEDVKALIETIPGLQVRSVVFDERQNERMHGRRSAYVRLQPPPLPTEASKATADAEKGENVPKDGDAINVAAWAVVRLRKAQPPLQLGGETVVFETGSQQVQLYVGNLSQEWQDDDKFVAAMERYGRLERAFVMRNAAGQSKGYGFVEFSLPSAALACKQAMDEIERNMRPDPRKQKDKAAHSKPDADAMKVDAADAAEGEGKQAQALRIGSWPDNSGRLVKLLRAEWAIMRRIDVLFSKVLYVANLRTTQSSHKELKDIFEQFGKVAEVTVPKNKQTNATKGFAFVAFANGLAADRAYRALEKSGSEEIGGALVSFANSAKATDSQTRTQAGKQGQRQQGLAGGRAQPPAPSQREKPGGMVRSHAGGRGANFGGHMMPPGAMALGMEDDVMRHQSLHMQAGMAAQAQMARQLEMRMQQQMRAQQAQMQAQLRQAQMQVQQAQQQAQQLQRQAVQAQAKAAAEAEARRRAEEEARRVAAAREGMGGKRGAASLFPGGGYGSAGTEAGGRAASGGYGSQTGYGSGGGGYGPAGSSGFGAMGGYGGSAGAGYGPAGGSSAGYGSQGYGTSSGGPAGYTEYGAAGYGGEYEASAGYAAGGEYGGEEMGYGGAASGGYDDGYGGGGGYGSQAGGYDRPGAGGMRKADYGGYGAAEAGYGGEAAAYDQHAGYGGYGQAGGSGQKRANPYQQGGYGGYGSGGGSYGMQGGGEYGGKRQRF